MPFIHRSTGIVRKNSEVDPNRSRYGILAKFGSGYRRYVLFFKVKNHLGEKNKKLYLNAKFLPSILHIFCLQFILFLPLWIQIRIRNADSQSCLIRI